MEPQQFKFGTVKDEQDTEIREYSYTNVWNFQKTSGPERLIIGPASGHVDLLIELSRVLPEPFGILYILSVPRGGNDGGRYQSAAPASRAAMEAFLNSFRDFLENDARQHLWIASLPAQATLVYDKHNVIYAYGELEKFKQILLARGLTRGEVVFPDPHVHNYNPKFDAEETRILSYAEWKKFPLAENDE